MNKDLIDQITREQSRPTYWRDEYTRSALDLRERLDALNEHLKELGPTPAILALGDEAEQEAYFISVAAGLALPSYTVPPESRT